MPLTTLDINAALVVIDLQKGIVAMPTVHPVQDVVARTAQLARVFREVCQTVVLVHVTRRPTGRTDAQAPKMAFPADPAELVPELDRQPTDILITKERQGAFHGTLLHEELQKRGITQIFLAGIATSLGVESTARSAYDLGYNVVFATDAITDRDADSHRHSMEKIFPRLGESESTESIVKRMQESSGSVSGP